MTVPARKGIARRLRIGVVAVVVAVLLVAVGVLVWANIVMQGDRDRALEVWTNDAVEVTSTDHSVVIGPTGVASGTGLVFIPGAKVDPYAYLYKLSEIVERTGATVVITKPILNLAFFDQRPLDTFTADVPGVDRWFVGGHSLGGVRACMLADNPEVDGLILFGSYCANDLTGSGLDVLSIAGSRDGLSTPEKIADAAGRLPADADFVEIQGLNHAGFGDYGVQPGDNTATISTEVERDEISDALETLLGP
ncbi:alpha/beta hydrolase [Conyzicola nivalis]|uniref:Alpha/beta hydrolase n=1 Tax=Conyzicola nivalis TaxID=1477021 RepID=A0A916SJ47_9MICO|nr:alpha/beta hydrolase [Conyzicola nivalis]GGB00106.1 alpha/beta hydrolase [Conyzicola nivalis]